MVKERMTFKNMTHRCGNRARDAGPQDPTKPRLCLVCGRCQYGFGEFQEEHEGVAVRVWKPMCLGEIPGSAGSSLPVAEVGTSWQDLEVKQDGLALLVSNPMHLSET